jgi:hypothetical protein
MKVGSFLPLFVQNILKNLSAAKSDSLLALAARQREMDSETLRQAEQRYAKASQAAYIAQQNYQSAADGSSQSLATAAHDVEHLIRLRDGTANLIGVALQGLGLTR